MLNILNQFDTQLFLWLNQLHAPWLDPIMWFFSLTKVWIPFYLLLAGWIVYYYRRMSWVILIAIGLNIFLSDRISSGIIKPAVCRLRPSHEPSLQHRVHIVNDYRGGKYGFVSSHAANSFALAMFLSLLFKRRRWIILFFLWAFLVSYSRIYLGVHYPGDIVGGALVGIGCSLIVFWGLRHLPGSYRLMENQSFKSEKNTPVS
ncbi:MAG: phosphatase PAP2 family protein [Bacteroidales bacterium]|nr:phosphatase PAP2 family protein [Bacteroidales bacterium]HOK98425.1 phosphatase PAP2 family protein [Bacteroidales bacterium]